MANIKVAVRVRPISVREFSSTGSEVVVRTDSNGISLTNLKVSSSKAGDSRERTRRYGFDYCFDSSNPEAENFADQSRIYETLGQSVLDAIFSGYNSCIVAYGQSASGKTYTMMGTKEDPGLTPRLCEGLFSKVDEDKRNEKTCCVSVSYLEIYNERVRDLLKPSSSTSGLRVREHPRLGPYVQGTGNRKCLFQTYTRFPKLKFPFSPGLTHHVVRTLGSLMSYVEEGTKARKTASTLQNPSSSRSHALLTIAVTPETSGVAAAAGSSASASVRRSEPSPRGGSKLRLVDLAGSESAATCSGVHRLKEGANINKSLVALGNVISALAERGSTGSGPGRRFIPYRDSSLTWLLKDALGGNATTIMLATISPASGSYNETAHTLRFAKRAQSVVNRPVVNEDPVAKIIRELRAEVDRLKSLLLEKNVEPASKALCSCQRNQLLDRPCESEDQGPREDSETTGSTEDSEEKSRKDQLEVKAEEEKDSRSLVPLRRSNSSDSLTTSETDAPLKRFGSCECLATRNRFASGYNRAKVTELNQEEDQISEIHESVFVDIPTLVAVLIKPDDSLQETSAQIEEICSDEVAEDGIDEFIESSNDQEAFEDAEKPGSIDHDERSSSVNSCHASGDNEADVYRNAEGLRSSPASKLKQKPRFCKQDSVDVLSVSSNLHTSKRFGSVEAIQKKKEPLFTLERSHTNLEKRSTVSDRTKKLNNIREIEDQKVNKNLWRDSKEQLQRKGSNDSDKSLKESNTQASTKLKNYARKPSLENLKRKTSKDSSSSSSKDEQILISSLTRDKLLNRKNSLDQESPQTRAHTPIQRAKRAEIVAAVTERLYSSKKATEEASGVRSPPEGTDIKSMARMKLQDISRKMLGKRRRVCVDTQTDATPTVRMRDTASLTETPQIVCQDVGVLTDNHEACESMEGRKTPTLRVKDMATLTEKPKTTIVRCKDVGSLANDLEEFDYEIHSPRNDSGILSDDTQNYAESNLSSTEVSYLCPETDRRVTHAENSTNTLFSSCRSFAVQTPRLDTFNHRTVESKAPVCSRQCCSSPQEPQNSLPLSSPEKSIISISLPDTISITIESTNILESRIAVMDTLDQEKLKISTRDGEVQTDEVQSKDPCKESFCAKEFTRSTLSQTDSRVFRIENIFQDPNNAPKCSKVDVGTVDRPEGTRIRNSITFRNSLGTSYVSKEGEVWEASRLRGEGFIRDGLITEAFITRKRGLNSKRPSAIVYDNPWRNWSVPGPVNATRSIDCTKGLEVIPSSWSDEIPVAGVTLSCSKCSAVVENNPTFLRSQMDSDGVKGMPETKSPSAGVSELNNNVDHDHSFSDDSLDYSENNLSNQLTVLKVDDPEQRDGSCPPDVVAHTKKDCPKLSTTVDAGNSESVDFEDSHVEFPKKKPTEPMETTKIHDYKSLILGRPSYIYEELEENPEEWSNRNTSGKKKVSFSSTHIPEKRAEQSQEKQDSKSTLKSIIKKRKKRNTVESLNVVRSSNEETDNSQQEEENFTFKNDWRKVQSTSSKETEDLVDFCSNSKQDRKKVKFSAKDACSESDSCENAEDEEEQDVSDDCTARNILQEYLTEAVTFMKNLNSINEYVNVTGMLERKKLLSLSSSRCTASPRTGRARKGGGRRKSSSSWNRDYVELSGRRVSPKDTKDYQDDDIISTESYERCLKGIQRLEDCIHRVNRHNDLLREKYGVDCESAGARLSLANPSTDPRAPLTDEFSIPRRTDIPLARAEDLRDSRLEDDLEKRIFDQLMNVANSARCRSSGRVQSRFCKLPDLGSRSSTTYSKLREKYWTKEPFSKDVCGSFNFDEALGSKDDEDITRYEITGNLSVARSSPSPGGINDDLDWMTDDDILPLGRTDYSSNSVNGTSTDKRFSVASSRTIGRDESPSILPRRGTVDSGIIDDDAPGRTSSRTTLSVQRVLTDDARERLQELDDYSRRIRDCGSKMVDMEGSSDIVHWRDKLKYPGSPRARFLELLRERRRIVESSRGTSAS
ncbi:uncharacterized protein LOC143179125 [Calliopsis andreniformis]|uniref:uncharacterized protein LOC143179125 n=1 Tax=Calliopsis andreniformis TaxID=337506 RepID=UPI003FCCCE5F